MVVLVCSRDILGVQDYWKRTVIIIGSALTTSADSRSSSQLGLWESERHFEDRPFLISSALRKTEAPQVLRRKLANGTS